MPFKKLREFTSFHQKNMRNYPCNISKGGPGLVRDSNDNLRKRFREDLFKEDYPEAKRLLGTKGVETEGMEKEDPVQRLLGAEYQDEFENVYKSLAIKRTTSNDTSSNQRWTNIFILPYKAWHKDTSSNQQQGCPSDKNGQPLHKTPNALSVRYNAWRYCNEF
eukprot:Gb_09822 [translate_table: standard]